LAKEFKETETKIEELISQRFGIENIDHKHVKNADNIALVTEMRDLMEAPPKKWDKDGLFTPYPEKIIPLLPENAKKLFLNRFYELAKEK